MATGGFGEEGLAPSDRVFSILELLNIIYENSEFKDVKNCRLVCRHWRDAAGIQLLKRGHLELKPHRATHKLDLTTDDIRLLSPSDYQKFTISRPIPRAVKINFRETLTTLHLKNISFPTVNELRRVVFHDFPQLTDVALLDVTLNYGVRQETALQMKVEEIPSVRKLTIEQTQDRYERRVGTDVFRHWHLEELLRTYRMSLKELHCPNLNDSCRTPKENVFLTLQSCNISLENLSFNFKKEQEMNSCHGYLAEFGHKLINAFVTSHDRVNVFNKVFEHGPVVQLRQIKAVQNNWSLWRGGDLNNLNELDICHSHIDSFSFIENMPALKVLSLPMLVDEPLSESFECASVHTLNWHIFRSRDHISCIGKVFPNVRKLHLKGIEEKHFHGGCTLARVKDVWPKVAYLKLSGFFGECLRNEHIWLKSLGNGNGNVNMHLLRKFLEMKDLTSFVYADIAGRDVYFGDDAATEVFLKMPNLKILRFWTCAMSDNVVQQLKEKLQVFTYEARV